MIKIKRAPNLKPGTMMYMGGSNMTKGKKSGSIFQGNKVVLDPNMAISDPFEALVAYALVNYQDEFEAERERCPYETNLGRDILTFKQQMTWFTLDRINPRTGAPIVKEFIKNTGVDKEDAKLLMQATDLFFDRFTVKRHHGRDVIVYGMYTRKEYRLVTANGTLFYPIGCKFAGRIHPYMGKFKTCGIVSRQS